jgi:hypothetical protein
MKWAAVVLSFLAVTAFYQFASAESGDISFWLPPAENKIPAEAQVKRNVEYFSVKLHSVYAYYKSGFLENIKKIVVASETCASGDAKFVQSTMVNKTWQKLDKEGDFIGVNDHLVVLSPAKASNIKIRVAFRGIGEDRFQHLFDALADSTLKTALSLSPATSATISAIAPTVQKLLASPYTAEDPRQILDISQSFIVYSDTIQHKVDSLREGYLVVVSSRERKSDDLSKILGMDTRDIRLSSIGAGLEYKDQGEWRRFRHNSYVVLSVTKTTLRGENESSNWFAKYTEAERTAEEKVIREEPFDKVKQEVIPLWNEGNILLFADQEYIHNERNQIKATHYKKLLDALNAKGDMTAFLKLDTKALGVPANFKKIAQEYEKSVAKQAGQVAVRMQDEGGTPLSDVRFRITNLDGSVWRAMEGTTDTKGEFVLKGVSPGRYIVETEQGGFSQRKAFAIDPNEIRQFEFKRGSAASGPTNK